MLRRFIAVFSGIATFLGILALAVAFAQYIASLVPPNEWHNLVVAVWYIAAVVFGGPTSLVLSIAAGSFIALVIATIFKID